MIDSDELRDQDCDDTCSETRWRIADEIDQLQTERDTLHMTLELIVSKDDVDETHLAKLILTTLKKCRENANGSK